MNTILRTDVFDVWLRDLRDAKGKARINARIIGAQAGNFGDCKQVGAVAKARGVSPRAQGTRWRVLEPHR